MILLCTNSHSLFPSYISFVLSLSDLACSLSFSLIHTHTHSHTLTHTHTHSHTLTHTHTHLRTYALFPSNLICYLSFSLTHTHSLSLISVMLKSLNFLSLSIKTFSPLNWWINYKKIKGPVLRIKEHGNLTHTHTHILRKFIRVFHFFVGIFV